MPVMMQLPQKTIRDEEVVRSHLINTRSGVENEKSKNCDKRRK
jgi:hypothetical protein